MTPFSRRRTLGLIALGTLAAPAIARAQAGPRRNTSSFTMQQ